MVKETYCRGLREEEEKDTREVKCMIVGVSKLICYCIQKKVSPFRVQFIHEPLINIHRSTMSDGTCLRCHLLRCLTVKRLHRLVHKKIITPRFRHQGKWVLNGHFSLCTNFS